MTAATGAPEAVVGIDVASVARVAAAVERTPRFAERVYTERERRDCARRRQRWASRWAAKEAVRKVYGSRGVHPLPAYRAIEVVRRRGGAPAVHVHGAPVGIALSLTDEGDTVVAVAVALEGAARRVPAVPEGLRLPDRPADGHKGSFGTGAILAGSHALSGAAYLAAMGCARGGAGLVRLCVPESLHPVMAVKCTEVMPHALPDEGRGVIGPAAVERFLAEHAAVAGAVVVGPGIGRDPATATAVGMLLDALPCPAVVDADALNCAAETGLDWHRARRPVVVTPHPAEMARLAGLTTAQVQAARTEVARDFAAARGVTVVLKGSGTVVASPDGRLHQDGHSVVALATGGTGDVLAGLAGAFLAGGLDPFDAAVAAVTVHAEAGLSVQEQRGRAGALATDVLDALPAAQERIRRALEARARRGGAVT